jgi:hypothetical protein
MEDLFKALQMYQTGVQQAAFTSAANEASAQMQQIQQSQLDDMQKRQALQQLANQSTLKMLGTGANAAQVGQAFNAIAPQTFGSVEQMQLEGELSGNKAYQQTASKIMTEREGRQMRSQQRMLDMELKKEYAKGMMDIQQEMIRQGMKPSQVKQEDVAFDTNIDMANQYLGELEQTIQNYGTAEVDKGVFNTEGSSKAAATLSQTPYKLAVTWSKLVDPNSTAREGEVKAFMDNMKVSGWGVSNMTAMANIKQLQSSVAQYAEARKQAKAAGQPPPQYPAELAKMLGKSGPSDYKKPPAGPIQTKRLPNGKVIRFRDLGNGQIEVAE